MCALIFTQPTNWNHLRQSRIDSSFIDKPKNPSSSKEHTALLAKKLGMYWTDLQCVLYRTWKIHRKTKFRDPQKIHQFSNQNWEFSSFIWRAICGLLHKTHPKCTQNTHTRSESPSSSLKFLTVDWRTMDRSINQSSEDPVSAGAYIPYTYEKWSPDTSNMDHEK